MVARENVACDTWFDQDMFRPKIVMRTWFDPEKIRVRTYRKCNFYQTAHE